MKRDILKWMFQQMRSSKKQKQIHKHRRQTCVCQGEGVGEGSIEIGRCKLLYTEWINCKVVLYSTGNCIQYSMIHHNGKEYGKECKYVYN